jgi:hypothetical protein
MADDAFASWLVSTKGAGYICERLVGYPAAFAGKPRSYRKSKAERRTLLIPTTQQAER